MNKKILIEEVARIQELMGKKLIVEQWMALAKVIGSLGDEFAEVMAKHADDLAKLAKAVSDDEAIKILAKLANAERKFADIIVPEVMSNLSTAVQKEISEIIDAAQKQLKGGTSREVVNQMVERRLKAIDTPFEGVRTVIKKNVDDALSGVAHVPKPLVPNPPKPVPNSPALVEQMRNTFDEWDRIVPGGLSVKDKALLSKGFAWRSIRAKLNYVANNLLNQSLEAQQKSLEKIVALTKKQQNLMAKGQESDLIYRTIDAELEALRKNQDYNKEILYKTLSEELDKKLGAGKGYDFVQKLKKNDAMSPDAQTYWRYLVDDTYIGKMFTLPRDKAGKFMPSEWIKNLGERTFMLLSTGNPRKAGEIFTEFFKTKGVLVGTAYWLGWLKLVQMTLWPAFLGFVDTMWYGFIRETGDEDFGNFWNTYKHFIKERFFDTFSSYKVEYDKETGKYIKGTREYDFWRNVNPVTWLWDDLTSGLDWHVAGGSQRVFRNLYERGRREMENVNIDPGQIENPLNQIVGYENKRDSFIDFGISAGYTVEELDKFQYDEATQTGTTSDGLKFKLTEDPETKIKSFKPVSQ